MAPVTNRPNDSARRIQSTARIVYSQRNMRTASTKVITIQTPMPEQLRSEREDAGAAVHDGRAAPRSRR